MIDYTNNTRLDEEASYIYGLLLSDGNLSLGKGNKGKVSMEVSYRDRDIVYELKKRIPGSNYSERKRATNFCEKHHSIVFYNCHLELRQWIMSIGFPPGKKSDIISPPNVPYDEFAFWRGFIDGDGSIGITGHDTPFISVVTASDNIARALMNFYEQYFGLIKNVNRNSRDNVYNIMINNEDAQQVARSLYVEHNDTGLALKRKQKQAKVILEWERKKKKATPHRKWTENEDLFIKSHDIKTSMTKLNRTCSSIKNRLWRIKRQNNES